MEKVVGFAVLKGVTAGGNPKYNGLGPESGGMFANVTLGAGMAKGTPPGYLKVTVEGITEKDVPKARPAVPTTAEGLAQMLTNVEPDVLAQVLKALAKSKK